jgi:hypothetical protein
MWTGLEDRSKTDIRSVRVSHAGGTGDEELFDRFSGLELLQSGGSEIGVEPLAIDRDLVELLQVDISR